MMKKKSIKANKNKIKNDDADDVVEAGPKRTRMTDYEGFVQAWSNAESVAEAAKVSGIKKTTASAIAVRLRKAGVVLKTFPRRGPSIPIDVKRLNKIASGKAS
jgi:hypothetical protein